MAVAIAVHGAVGTEKFKIIPHVTMSSTRAYMANFESEGLEEGELAPDPDTEIPLFPRKLSPCPPTSFAAVSSPGAGQRVRGENPLKDTRISSAYPASMPLPSRHYSLCQLLTPVPFAPAPRAPVTPPPSAM